MLKWQSGNKRVVGGLELGPLHAWSGLMSVQRCFMQDPFSQTERDRNAREGKGNDGPSSATLRWLETPRRRGEESDRNRMVII